ncbi:MAG TPA: hypothetical protein VK213_07540 [Bacteroidales bacterium]|nr:hypothetical protein [Bacteroidales bacterium]
MITAVTNVKSNADYKCLIHLDRLSLTFRVWSGSTFQDIRNPEFIPQEQLFNEITIIHDTSPGLGAYYHSYRVFYKGHFVGKLHAATKLKKHELQFDYSKEVFYALHSAYWYEVYAALITNLGIIYNNIMYIEIAVDTNKDLVGLFGLLYQFTFSNNLRSGERYKLKANIIVHVMNNGHSFLIDGSENEISIYNKSSHSENFVQEYFLNNGLENGDIYRIESRLTWNYIRYLRNKKGLDINVETLLDLGKLANIFKISTINKITFKDMLVSTIDCNRNKRFQSISIIDDLDIDTAEIGKLNPELRASHYKNPSVDENIMRQNYFLFLDTGNKKYLRNFKSSGLVAGYNRGQLLNFVNKHNIRYHGNRTHDITERMEFATGSISGNFTVKVSRLFHSIIKELKSVMADIF